MLILWILYLMACLFGTRISKGFPNYMDKTQTTAIKGIFAGIIMFSHFMQYIKLSDSTMDVLFKTSIHSIGQLMVVMFFFYSGYGIVVSSKKKPNYFNTFFKHRILHTLLYFDLAVLLFVVCNLCMGTTYPIKRILLSFVGWSSVGNSNWFVFAIMCAYLIVFAAALTQKGRINQNSLLMITAGCLIYTLVMCRIKEAWWYNTILAFPAGMYYGYYKDRFDHLLETHYWLCIAICILLFVICKRYNGRFYIYLIYAVLFALIIVLITYKVRINNRFLAFMGKYSFDIYLLQRIPAMLLQYYFSNQLLYFAFFALGTIICAVLFHKICNRVLSAL